MLMTLVVHRHVLLYFRSHFVGQELLEVLHRLFPIADLAAKVVDEIAQPGNFVSERSDFSLSHALQEAEFPHIEQEGLHGWSGGPLFWGRLRRLLKRISRPPAAAPWGRLFREHFSARFHVGRHRVFLSAW
jgi:hypothetical protein